jgi:hypothetical protein
MTVKAKEHIIEYSCRKKPSTIEEYKKIQERIDDPYTLTGLDKLRAFYKWKGLNFDESIIEKIIKEHPIDE